MEELKKQWLPRGAAGGLAGLAAHVLLGYLLGCFSLIGPAEFTGFRFPDCGFPRGIEWAGVLFSFVLFALLGAEVGIATIPFADSGRELVARSLIHYAATAATVCLWAGLNVCSTPADYLAFLAPLTLVYAIVWLGRWVGWYGEVAAIRAKLGLAPGPSPLHWRESLPYVGFAVLLCLGRRHGFCPIYPAACVGFILLFIPLARLCSNMADGALIPIAAVSVVLGNAAGAVRHNMKKTSGREPD